MPAHILNAGDIVHSNHNNGKLFRHPTIDDLDGTFTIDPAGVLLADLSASISTDVLGDVEFVTDGALAGNALLANYLGTDSLSYFPMDAATGLPSAGIEPTPTVFATGTTESWGVAQDPITGYIWSIQYSGATRLIQIADSGIFWDGFEDGTTDVWSSQSP